MRSFIRSIYSPPAFDVIFAGAGAVSAWGLYSLFTVPIQPIEPADSPLAKAGILGALVVGGCLLSTFTSKLDQRCAEDFMFQTLTKSAFIAIIASFFAVVGWYSFFVREFGALPSYATVMLNLACWSVSYLIVRIRGTGA